MDMENSIGLKVKFIKVNGKTVNNMGLEFILDQQNKKNKENGLMEKELDGLVKINRNNKYRMIKEMKMNNNEIY